MEANENINTTAEEQPVIGATEATELKGNQIIVPDAATRNSTDNPHVDTSGSIQQENNFMEVHHHGHVHQEKKWKEYLFQFFMLFLAVFCGFLAEYKLEQTIESHREEEYMASMVQDLKSDTAAFRLAITRFNKNADHIDTLFKLLKNGSPSNTSEVYLNARMVIGSYYRLFYNNRTFEQMKSSGNLRLVRQTGVADSITSYYQSLKYVDETRELLNQRHSNVSLQGNLIFDSYVFQKMIQRYPYKIVPYLGNPPLMPYTRRDLNKYFESLTLLYSLELIQASSLKQPMLGRTERLIKLIEGKYHIQ